MRVILLTDLKNLGKKGQVIQVAPGYARNYLFPKGLAVEATEGKIKELASVAADAARKKAKEEEKAKALAARLNGQRVQVYRKAGEEGKLFGAVNNSDVAEVLKKEFGIEVDKRKIILKDPIKRLGVYIVQIRLYPHIEALVEVHVLAG